MYESMLENTIANLIQVAGLNLLRGPTPGEPCDFLVRLRDGSILAIEVQGGFVGSERAARILKDAKRLTKLADKIVVVVRDEMFERSSLELFKLRQNNDPPIMCLGLSKLPRVLGIAGQTDLSDPKTVAALQVAAFTDGIERYSDAPLGPDPAHSTLRAILKSTTSKASSLPEGFFPLRRQFSHKTISRLLSQEGGDLRSKLRLGQRCPKVTILLSDLKNFSDFVSAVDQDDLQDIMLPYYQRARELVWKYGGTLDKFIGDAVLAVFGYPFQQPNAPAQAIKLAIDLVRLGNSTTEAFNKCINEHIDGGTRVGVASGDIHILNIGQDEPEVSLVGDVINLAARLEKNCEVDGILIDHITYHNASKASAAFIKSLNATNVEINPSQAKGQTRKIRAWAVPPLNVVGAQSQ